MIHPDSLQESKAIQRRTGRTFHVATRLLPERVRHPTYVMYAFFRIADDVVDDPDPDPPAVQRAELARIHREATGDDPATDPVLAAFATLRERHDIPRSEVEAFLDAMEQDVSPERIQDQADLEAYLRGSSVAVGYMMLSVMGATDAERARPHARALGEAFQVTNFLRDVREDVLDYDRIYLPRDVLARHGVDDAQIERLEFSEGFADAMVELLAWTEERYRTGVDGIALLPPDCQFGVLLAAVLYAEHHRLIRAQGHDVLSHRPTLSVRRRLALVARTWWHWRRTGDPRATFDGVSAVAPDAGTDSRPQAERPGPDARDVPATEPARGRPTGTEPARERPTGTGLPGAGVVAGLRSWLPLGVLK